MTPSGMVESVEAMVFMGVVCSSLLTFLLLFVVVVVVVG